VHSADSQKILNQISAARGTLLDPDKKRQYDRELNARLPQNKPIPAARPIPLPMRPVPVMPSMPVPPPAPVAPPSYSMPQPVAPAYSPEPAGFGGSTGSNLHFSTRRKKQSGGGIMGLVKMLVGGTGGLAIALLILWIAFRSDPFSLFGPKPDSLAKNDPAANPPDKTKLDPNTTSVIAGETPQAGAAESSSPGSGATTGNTGTPANGTAEPAGTKPPGTKPPGTEEAGSEPDDEPARGSSPKPPSPATVGSPPAGTSPPSLPDIINININVTPEVAIVPQHPIPTAEVQKAKLEEVKELYRADFDSGAKPANRPAFIEFLMKTAHTLTSDPAAQFVLLREAYEKALLQKDFLLAADLVDELERGFEMDPLKLRLAVLTQASAAAKSQAERTTVMACAGELVEYAVQSNQLAEAQKLSKIAEGQARSLGDNQVKAKMLAMAAEIEKRAAELGPVDRAQQALATNPADPAANLVVGKYRCLSLGDWPGGIAALAKSSDAALAAAAQQDIAGATADFSAAKLGELWFEIAMSQAPWAGFYRRAEHWYRLATNDSQDLEQAKIQQRLEQIAAMNLPIPGGSKGASQPKLQPFAAMMSAGQHLQPVDLFTKIPLPQPRGSSGWSARGPNSIDSDSATPYARVQTTFTPPREYQLTLKVRRMSGAPERMGPLVIGLVSGKSQFLAVIDARAAGGGYASLLTVANARTLAENSTVQETVVPRLPASPFGGIQPEPFRPGMGAPLTDLFVICQVRRRGVTITVDGRLACQYEGDLGQLSVPREWSIGDSKVLFLGSHLGDFRVDAWTVEPLPAAAGAFGAPGLAP
jgi:hypothetical protein